MPSACLSRRRAPLLHGAPAPRTEYSIASGAFGCKSDRACPLRKWAPACRTLRPLCRCGHCSAATRTCEPVGPSTARSCATARTCTRIACSAGAARGTDGEPPLGQWKEKRISDPALLGIEERTDVCARPKKRKRCAKSDTIGSPRAASHPKNTDSGLASGDQPEQPGIQKY